MQKVMDSILSVDQKKS